MSCAAQPSAAAAATGDEEDDEEPVAAAVAAPAIFTAPAPTGEVSGARSGIGLPGLRLTMPRLSIETPELSVFGFSRSRRDPQMHIDAAAAPASGQSPLLFGNIPTHLQQNGAAAAAASPRTKRGDDEGDAAAAGPGNEGCTSLESRKVELLTRQVNELQKMLSMQQHEQNASTNGIAPKNSADPWASARATEVSECEQSVAELSGQLSELQRLVTQLAELQAAEPGLNAVPQTAVPKSKKVNPWQFPEEGEASQQLSDDPDEIIAEEQAERIARLEAQLAKLNNVEPVQRASHQQEDSQAGTATLRPLPEPKPSAVTAKAKKSVFSRLGLSRSSK